ncbi:MAG: response regulator [Pyrinomonadaceae bacterium]|nr:response regulator [Pyrinomonadaceae bacterium]
MLRGRKLLLADDSIAIQKVIELTFEDEGMQVVSVANGRQAVERLEEVRPDVVLADVFMPELNGYEVCEHVKRDERFRHIPVILLVGSFEPFNEAEARRVGADDYLTKPFQSIRQMVNKVGSLFSGHKGEAATQELPAQPDQSQAESQTRRDNLEFSTADTAPLPQHMRREAIEDETAAATPEGPFADLQLDDEMIEETPASEFGSTTQTAAAATQQRPTQPVSTQELADMGVKTATTSGQSLAAGGSWTGAEREEAREAAPAQSATPTTARDAAASPASEDTLLDLDDVEMPRAGAMAEADDFILDLQDAAEARSEEAPRTETFPQTFETATPSAPEVDESVVEAEMVEEMTAAAPQAEQFTEAQTFAEEERAEFTALEEQAPIAAEPASYQQDVPSPAAVEVEPETQQAPDTSQMQETSELSSEAQFTSTAEVAENLASEATTAPYDSASQQAEAAPVSETQQPSPAGQISLEQLSPEAIDAIARRVVEQLSTKVVEQIAWEVVPPLAELLIKRRLEEGKQ